MIQWPRTLAVNTLTGTWYSPTAVIRDFKEKAPQEEEIKAERREKTRLWENIAGDRANSVRKRKRTSNLLRDIWLWIRWVIQLGIKQNTHYKREKNTLAQNEVTKNKRKFTVIDKILGMLDIVGGDDRGQEHFVMVNLLLLIADTRSSLQDTLNGSRHEEQSNPALPTSLQETTTITKTITKCEKPILQLRLLQELCNETPPQPMCLSGMDAMNYTLRELQNGPSSPRKHSPNPNPTTLLFWSLGGAFFLLHINIL